MAPVDVEALLRESIVKVCGIPAARVRSDSTLDDLGIDSLAAAEVFVDIEITLGRDLPVDLLRRLEDVETVREVAALLGTALEPLAPPSA
jgi:acyl carrier protein